MATRLTFLGHSAFQIETADKTILIDPFLTGNPAATVSAEELSPDVIIISHGHADHVGDTIAIAKRTGALVIANFEICTWLQQQGIDNVHPQHIGGAKDHGFGIVKLTIAHHGSMLPDGANGGSPCGILLKLNEGTIYHAADTGLFSDMKLIGDEGIDIAILPIGDNFTMGPDDALRAIKFLTPKQVIPIHYNTWPIIEQNPTAWAKRAETETNAQPIIMSPNDSHTL